MYIFERKEIIIKFFLLAHVRCDLILKRDLTKKKTTDNKETLNVIFLQHTHIKASHTLRAKTLAQASTEKTKDGRYASFHSFSVLSLSFSLSFK